MNPENYSNNNQEPKNQYDTSMILNCVASVFLGFMYIFAIFAIFHQTSSYVDGENVGRSIDSGALFGISAFCTMIGLPVLIVYLIGIKKHRKFSVIGIVLLVLLLLSLYLYTWSKQ